MNSYQRESHLRSLIKGISWRFVATTDTILVALLITCLFGRCSIADAVAIGAAEFLLKLLVYYLHERAWQKRLLGRPVKKIQTVYKSVSWRVIATTMTFLISGTVLDRFDQVALLIALTELFTKFALYYLHERLWLMLPLGRVRRYVSRLIKRQ